MSFESLTPEEREQLKQAQNGHKLLTELLSHSDAETRKAAKRLVKKQRPDLRFEELEADEAAERATKSASEEVKALRAELEQERAQRLKAEESDKIRGLGFDPKAVYEAMEKRGIVNLDTALAMFQAEQQLGESTSGSVSRFKNPAQEVASDIIKEVSDANGRIDIEAMRGKLINNFLEESGARKTNPLGFLRQ